MTDPLSTAGRTGIVTGLANERDIAFGCSRAITGVAACVDGGLDIRA